MEQRLKDRDEQKKDSTYLIRVPGAENEEKQYSKK